MCACETISPKLTTKVADQTVNAGVDTHLKTAVTH